MTSHLRAEPHLFSMANVTADYNYVSCSAAGGVPDPVLEVCTYYLKLSELCYKVSFDTPENPKWFFDGITNGDGVGCKYSASPTFLGLPIWAPETYVLLGEKPDPDRAYGFDEVKLTFRHARSPYVVAQHLTAGTMAFAPISLRWLGVASVYVMMAAAPLSLVGLCLLLVLLTRRNRVSTQMHATYVQLPPSESLYLESVGTTPDTPVKSLFGGLTVAGKGETGEGSSADVPVFLPPMADGTLAASSARVRIRSVVLPAEQGSKKV